MTQTTCFRKSSKWVTYEESLDRRSASTCLRYMYLCCAVISSCSSSYPARARRLETAPLDEQNDALEVSARRFSAILVRRNITELDVSLYQCYPHTGSYVCVDSMTSIGGMSSESLVHIKAVFVVMCAHIMPHGSSTLHIRRVTAWILENLNKLGDIILSGVNGDRLNYYISQAM